MRARCRVVLDGGQDADRRAKRGAAAALAGCMGLLGSTLPAGLVECRLPQSLVCPSAGLIHIASKEREQAEELLPIT
jgi:hypothetical protein